MTRITVGRAAPNRANDESVAIHLKGERARLSPEQARWLCERIDEELALLDGGAVESVDAVDAVDATEADGDLEKRLEAVYEYVDADVSTGEQVAREKSEEGADAQSDVEQHSSEEMGAPEYRVGEKVPDEVSEESDENAEASSDTPLDVECGVCGRGFESEAGKNIHKGQVHDDGQEHSSDVQALDELLAMDGIGERRVHLLVEAGFSDLEDIYDAAVDAIAIDGISESSATEISRFAAEQLSGSREDDDEGGESEGETVLDHERIATAMDSIGIDDSVATGDVVHAVDVHNKPFQVSSQLDIPRADADDLIERLELQDALESDDDLARERFDGGEAA